MAPGTWSLFGVNLPDFNITERYAASKGIDPNQFNQNLGNNLKNMPAVGTLGSIVQSGFNPNAGSVLGLQGDSSSQVNTPWSPTSPQGPGYGGPLPQKTTQTILPQQQTAQEPQQQEDPFAGVRNEIGSGWDNYINSLNSQFEGLSSQKVAQEGVAQSAFDQNMNNLSLSNQQGLQQLGGQRVEAQSNQKKTLKDLAGNIRSSFDAGNVYLGSRGAGDSSAANQYAYALTKMGTQQRSDVMNQTAKIMDEINGRETNLRNIFDTESKNLKLAYDSQLQSISQWFADAQNQIRMAQSQGQLGKSQDLTNLSKDILNQAMARVDQINQEVSNRRSMLEQWAIEKSNNINELKSNMSQVAQYSPELPGFSPVTGTPTVDSSGNFNVPQGYGSTTDERKRGIFG